MLPTARKIPVEQNIADKIKLHNPWLIPKILNNDQPLITQREQRNPF